jgi:putative flippase GtrA
MIITIKKWIRFNAIGVMGVGLQLLLLSFFRTFFHFGYLLSTAIAVQCALIHNFFWHQRWTWKSAVPSTRKESLRRFVKFNSSSGSISILGNLGFTSLIVQAIHLPYLISNLLAIATCNIANFLLARNFAFRTASSLV